jgi:hypothetical protein
MNPSLIIDSAHDGRGMELSDYSGDYYVVTLRGPHFHGTARVYAYEPSAHLAAFFRDLAEHWRGWSGKKEWSSLEGEFSLIATSDSTGHTSLAVRLRSGPYPFEWTLTAVLLIEAAQLEQIAKKVDRFFAAERPTSGSSQ